MIGIEGLSEVMVGLNRVLLADVQLGQQIFAYTQHNKLAKILGEITSLSGDGKPWKS